MVVFGHHIPSYVVIPTVPLILAVIVILALVVLLIVFVLAYACCQCCGPEVKVQSPAPVSVVVPSAPPAATGDQRNVPLPMSTRQMTGVVNQSYNGSEKHHHHHAMRV